MLTNRISKQLKTPRLLLVTYALLFDVSAAQISATNSIGVGVTIKESSKCPQKDSINCELVQSIERAFRNLNYFAEVLIKDATGCGYKNNNTNACNINLSLEAKWSYIAENCKHDINIIGELTDKRGYDHSSSMPIHFELEDKGYICDASLARSCKDTAKVNVTAKLEALAQEIARTVLVLLEHKIRVVVTEFNCYGDSGKYNLGKAIARMIGSGINLSKKMTLLYIDQDILSKKFGFEKSNIGDYLYYQFTKIQKQKLMYPNYLINGVVYVQDGGIRIDANYVDIETGQVKLSVSRHVAGGGKVVDALSVQVDELASELRQAIELDYLSRKNDIPTIAVIGLQPLSGNNSETLGVVDIITKKLKKVQNARKFRVVENEKKLREYLRNYPPENSIIGRQFGADNLLKIRYERSGTEFVLSIELHDLKDPDETPIIVTESGMISFINEHLNNMLVTIFKDWPSDSKNQNQNDRTREGNAKDSQDHGNTASEPSPGVAPIPLRKSTNDKNKGSRDAILAGIRGVTLRTAKYSVRARGGIMEFEDREIYLGLDSQFIWDVQFSYYFPNKHWQIGLLFNQVSGYDDPDRGLDVSELSGFAVLRFNWIPIPLVRKQVNIYAGIGIGAMSITHRFANRANREVELGFIYEFGMEIAIAKHFYIDAGANFQKSIEKPSLDSGLPEPLCKSCYKLGGWSVPVVGFGFSW